MAEIQVYNPVDQAVAEWLNAKSARNTSGRTGKAYHDTMADFRAALAERNADLLSDPALVAMTAGQWAGGSRIVGRNVKESTYNQRLAIISSFYVYYARIAALSGRVVANPIAAVGKREVQAYAGAQPMDRKDLKRRLRTIDRTTLQGKRDYALLALLVRTGRRLSEIVSMKRRDLTFGEMALVDFPYCKGGKQKRDRLTHEVTAALVTWLAAYYGPDFAALPGDTPVWVSLSRRNYGQPMGAQTVGDVCQKYLGTSKVHTLRHTFAVAMQDAGADISEIQHRLGHSSAATTSLYLEQLRSADNPYGGKLDELFGIGD